MSKYATGTKPDMTNNFFLMQDLDLTLFTEVADLVWAASSYDPQLMAGVMKHVSDITWGMIELTRDAEDKSNIEIKYNWLPVRFHMRAVSDGKVEELNGFKINVSCTGNVKAVDVFFAKDSAIIHSGVRSPAQMVGWISRLPKGEVPAVPQAPEPEPTMEVYTVWNEARTEGFTTLDKQLAYEVRKCATTNLFDEFGNRSDVAVAFCEHWGDENLTTETRVVSAKLSGMTSQGLANLFTSYSMSGESGRFIFVKNKRDKDPTIHAILLLNEKGPLYNEDGPELMEPKADAEGFTNHDFERFIENATRDDVMELVRCGVRYYSDVDLFELPRKKESK